MFTYVQECNQDLMNITLLYHKKNWFVRRSTASSSHSRTGKIVRTSRVHLVHKTNHMTFFVPLRPISHIS